MEMYGKWNNKEERDNDPGYQHMKKKLAKKSSSKTWKHGKNASGDSVYVLRKHAKLENPLRYPDHKPKYE